MFSSESRGNGFGTWGADEGGRSLRPLFLSLLPGAQRELEGIKKTREALANELSELISELGVASGEERQ